MSDSNLLSVFDRFLGVFKYRSSKRKDFFETEVEALSEEFLGQLRYLISEIDLASRTFEQEVRHTEQLLLTNDSWEGLSRVQENLQNVMDTLNLRRQKGRAERLAIQRVADKRRNSSYFEKSALEIINDSERELTQELFEAINGYFTREGRVYSHDLVEPLKTARFSLEEVRRLAPIGTTESKNEILEHLIFCQRSFERARDRAQESYARIASLKDTVRIVLNDT